jgi:hypothetical protein
VGGEVRGNYCTLNPLNLKANGALANGNLDWSASAAYGHAVGTVGVSSGKWYCEFTVSAIGSGIGVGVTSPQTAADFLEGNTLGIGYYSSNGNVYYSGGNSAYGTTFTTNNVIGVALDLDNGKVFFSKDGTWQNSGNPATGTNPARTGLSGTYTFGINVITGSASGVFNFGQRPFAYTAPSGYKALCSTNLPTPTILNGATAMDVKLYTGNGSTQTISGLGFSPDFVWTKCRSTNYSNQLIDAIRGGTNVLFSDRADQEGTYQSITAFNSDGYTLSTELGVNGNGSTFAAWCWDAGSSTVTNTSGTISSQVRANPSAGFSIVTYTASGVAGTVGHGLNVTPGMIIAKSRNNTSGVTGWAVYHSSLGSGSTYMILNLTDPAASSAGYWGTPNSSTFGVAGTLGFFNNNGSMVAYCFAPVAGYSSFGSYTGNGNASNDGPFVYTGFRPRWVMIKSTSSGNWTIFDALRVGYNVDNEVVYPNLASGSGVDNDRRIDILSNGFKIRNTAFGSTDINGTTATTYIYAAFAEAPFQYARAR